MKRRIALWALLGFAVALGWAAAVRFMGALPDSPALLTLVQITCPAAFLHYLPISYYLFVVLNAAIYAGIGLIVELLRLLFLHRSPAPNAR